MKKIILGLLLGLSALMTTNSFAWNQRQPFPVEQCKAHAPYGFPQVQGPIQPLCRQAYLVGYDAPAKIPRFVMYELLPQNALGCVARTNAFATNQFVPNGATPGDYAGTGYDKGHAAPDGDLSWSQQVEYESFLMTNMYPQHGSLNRGIWKLLETSVRGWAVQRNQPYTIFVGAFYGQGDEFIANGAVSVNNKTVTEMGHRVQPGDVVKFNGKEVKSVKFVYILMTFCKLRCIATSSLVSHAIRTKQERWSSIHFS